MSERNREESSLDAEKPGTTSAHPLLFGVLSGICLTFLFQLGTLAVILPDVASPLGSLVLPLIGISQLLLMFLPTLYLARRRSASPYHLLRFRSPSIETLLLAAVGTLALWQLLQGWFLVQEIYLIPERMLDSYRMLQQETAKGYLKLFGATGLPELLLSLIVGGAIPALCEETLFRGLSQGSFEQALSPPRAIALGALLFAFLHLQPILFIPLFSLGAFFGWMTWRSGSIFPAVLGHALFNAISIVGLYIVGDQIVQSDSRPHTASDLVVLLPMIALSLTVLLAVVWRMRKVSS